MIENANKKQFLLKHLRNAEEVYVLFSKCTRMPYVECDAETFDDQIYIFRKKDDAEKIAEEYEKAQIAVEVKTLKQEQFLSFYSGLFLISVNAIVTDKGEAQEVIQVKDLVTPPDYSKLPKGQIRVENPEFHLTALYLMQELRKEKRAGITPEIKELEEEMFNNFRKGNYIVPIKENSQIPLVKMSDEKMYQPIFSDIGDFRKFIGEQEFRPAVIPYDKLKEVVVPQAEGVVINPMGIHVVLKREQLN